MQSLKFLLLAVAVVLVGLTNTLSPTGTINAASVTENQFALPKLSSSAKNTDKNNLRSLRMGNNADNVVEERRLSRFSSITKFLPWTKTHQLQKALRAAEKKKIAEMFVIKPGTTEDELFKIYFPLWKNADKSSWDVLNGLQAAKNVNAKKISNSYQYAQMTGL
ncbi:RxLR effector protein [Phytophthora megakarya]|uniref:RxLR effector protein n=1 Tax=Phytophthora megakarya TaxID=4795 RepID=A0A225VB88_9STRA|nr:RxLR effector protein [Phytophthora megakarya]